ncbi:MAG: pilus assembly protein [Chloroflexi bacterium]|nr:MAG: pilus assembly protein [Chloroflexota bacterium]
MRVGWRRRHDRDPLQLRASHRVGRGCGLQGEPDRHPRQRPLSELHRWYTMRQLKRDERGVGTIELALILPVLILLTVGFLDLARALNAAIVVGGASQEGAHYAVLNPAAAPSAIASAARARVQPLSPGSVTVTAEYYDNASARFVPWPSTGIPASSPTPTGVVVRVSVSYPWSAVSTLVDSFFSGTGSRTVTANALMETRR